MALELVTLQNTTELVDSTLEIILTTTTLVLGVNTGPQGPPGSIANFVVGEVPTGLINGSNQNYSTADDFVFLWVFKNGVRQALTTDYTIIGADTFQMVSAPLTGDTLLVDYTTA